MATRRENVLLALADTESFTGPMVASASAAPKFMREWALMAATWEPHDWGDFA